MDGNFWTVLDRNFQSAKLFDMLTRPTFTSTSTYSSATAATGWTASLDADGKRFGGTVSIGTIRVSVGGAFTIWSSYVADRQGVAGLFLWRPTGLDTGVAIANDDTGQVASPAGGRAVENVLANDWINGEPATAQNVELTLESSSDPGITLDPIDNATRCDGAAVRVTVPPYVVNVNNDAGTASPSTGGRAVQNVLANDVLGGAPADLSQLELTAASSSNPAVTLNTTEGSVNVAQGAELGTHTELQQIYELANLTNCDQASAMVR